MCNIFVSWASPDAERVELLLTALRLTGVDIWDYSRDGEAGNNVEDQVAQAIQNADHALFLLSDATAGREWIEREAAYVSLPQRTGRIQVIPVWIGPHDSGILPAALPRDLHIEDLSDASINRLYDFAARLGARCGMERRITIPTAVFAMTSAEAEWLFERWKVEHAECEPWPPEVLQICTQVGMEDPPALFDYLARRYKDYPQSFTPFDEGKPIAQLLDEVIATVNQRHDDASSSEVAVEEAALSIYWVHDWNDMVRMLWGDLNSLLVVDCLSVYHPRIERVVQNLPELHRSAILWIPPYTQRTGRLHNLIEAAVKRVGRLGDAFVSPKPRNVPATFEAITQPLVDRWLSRTLLEIRQKKPVARQTGRAAMRQSYGGRVDSDIPLFSVPRT